MLPLFRVLLLVSRLVRIRRTGNWERKVLVLLVAYNLSLVAAPTRFTDKNCLRSDVNLARVVIPVTALFVLNTEVIGCLFGLC